MLLTSISYILIQCNGRCVKMWITKNYMSLNWDEFNKKQKEYKHKPSRRERFILQYTKEFSKELEMYIIHHLRAEEYEKARCAIKQRIENFKNRYEVPKGETKAFYKKLLKQTQERIDYFKPKIDSTPEGEFYNLIQDSWIEKKKKINSILKYHGEYGTETLKLAKQYPMENLLEFNGAGFAKCPSHGPENTPSAKLYKERNKIHCFGCGADLDSIDVCMIINNIPLGEAIKKLCQGN